MITIIEGPDCSGKTSLMHALFPKEEGVVHEHSGPPSNHGAWADYTNMLFRLWNTQHTMNVVFDRFIYGELVYGPLLRPKTKHDFTSAHARMLERILLSMQGVLIAAQTDFATTRQLFLERQEQELLKSDSQLQTTWELFELLFNSTILPSLPMVRYDFQQDTLAAIQLAVRNARGLENQGPGLGSWNPGKVTLMVGEQPNTKTTIMGWPFIAKGESSLWLAQQLDRAEIKEAELYWVNALDQKGIETSPAFIEQLQPTKIIALGKAAEIWCKKHLTSTFAKGLDVRAVPHPQFWKRFMSHEPYPLFEALDKSPLQAELPLASHPFLIED